MSNRDVTEFKMIGAKQKQYLCATYLVYMISTRNDKGPTEELLEIIIGKMDDLRKFFL